MIFMGICSKIVFVAKFARLGCVLLAHLTRKFMTFDLILIFVGRCLLTRVVTKG